MGGISMKTKIVMATAVLALMVTAPLARAQAPTAKKVLYSLTEPSSGTSATIRIDKKGLVKINVLSGNVQFLLKLSGVLDAFDQPVNNVGNTFQVDLIVGGIFSTENFVFDIANGKVAQKFLVTNGSVGTGGAAGDAVEIRRVRVLEAGSGFEFGSGGITLR
jgi:hypothetical protein